MSYLDIAHDLSRLEEMTDTPKIKKLINEIRFDALSNDDVDWKEYFHRLIEVVDGLLYEEYEEGYQRGRLYPAYE